MNKDEFVHNIRQIHNKLHINYDALILDTIGNFKSALGLKKEDLIGYYYQSTLKGQKSAGVVYTPEELSEILIHELLDSAEVNLQSEFTILDPCAGAGAIIIPLYKYLLKRLLNCPRNIRNNDINTNYIEKVKTHIIEHYLYACDIDETALMVLRLDLYYISGGIISPKGNFKCSDFLMEDESKSYDYIIGNPPYVGPKSIDKDYRKELSKDYSSVYKDKADLSYCFFQRALEVVNDDGKICFVTSRYFMEGQNGVGLRKYLIDQSRILKIIDFYGLRPFSMAGIDPVIILLKKEKAVKYDFEFIRPTKDDSSTFISNLKLKNKEINTITQSSITLYNEKWLLINEEEKIIYQKVENSCFNSLEDICRIPQGIITGLDKAFIVDEETIKNKVLEKDLLRPWIKGKDIRKPSNKKKYIIYTDERIDIDNYPNVKSHLATYKMQLEARRECIRGVRKWYEITWPRQEEIFNCEKIIYQYKGTGSNFVLSSKEYFSADIYALILINEEIKYYSLCTLLNSKLYDLYIKLNLKKLGRNLYEYYPSRLRTIKIPLELLKHNINEGDIYDYFNVTDKMIKDAVKYL